MSSDGGLLEIKEHFHMMVFVFFNNTNNSSTTILSKTNWDKWKCAVRGTWRDFYQYDFHFFLSIIISAWSFWMIKNNNNNSTASTAVTLLLEHDGSVVKCVQTSLAEKSAG